VIPVHFGLPSPAIPGKALAVLCVILLAPERPLYGAGNAWTDPVEDNKGAVDFWYSHALISEDTRDGIYAMCNFSQIGPLKVSASIEGAANNSKVRA